MNIGIIGAGNIGGVLAETWGALGHTVSIASSRGPETLVEVAKRTALPPGTSPAEIIRLLRVDAGVLDVAG